MTRSATVLLVEDDSDGREILQDLLTDGGYRVTVAKDGAEALSALPGLPRPCVAVIDLMMPGMNGWQLVEAMRADARIATIPVIAVSAGSYAAPPQADASLGKPFRLEQLVAEIERLTAHLQAR